MRLKKRSKILISAIIVCVALAAIVIINCKDNDNLPAQTPAQTTAQTPTQTVEKESLEIIAASSKNESPEVKPSTRKTNIDRIHSSPGSIGRLLTEHELVPEGVELVGDMENAILVFVPDPNHMSYVPNTNNTSSDY